ncbi:hypothetical protein DH2020_043937 [Rehmannia glutinosa]|uniref:APO domain-containing protein n=1 Tax=Rehmannia glutinosa TaxID=99300 RepID=A0ABR0UIZ4_REHGL
MDSVCLHSQFSRTDFLHSKGRTCLKFDILKCGTWQGLNSLYSFKNSCSGLIIQLNFKIPLKQSAHVQALGVECQNNINQQSQEALESDACKCLQSFFSFPLSSDVISGRWCSEIHVGPVGHPFKSCRGPRASIRKGAHEWGEAVLEDILVPVGAYHLYDRLGKRIPHEERFSVPRIPAVVELCIQAGVDLPEYPTKRRRKPIIRIGKKEFVDADESELPDPDPEAPKPEILAEILDSEIVPPSSKEDTTLLAEETLQAWEEMREGAKRLMKMYPVRACGYCPEVHVGPTGHKAQNCGAHKHQQRNGQHGWQAAVLDDLIPPKYVWHVPDVNKPLERELRNFYGQAPTVVELCAQAGASVPEHYKPTMRLDVGIPTDVREAEMVV